MKKLLLILLLLVASPAWATTYYVNKSGSDANSCATAQSATDANAKLTIAAGIGCMSGGDTLNIGDGTYVETLHPSWASGSSGSPTTIQCETANLCKVVPNDTGNYYAILIDGESSANHYLTFNGIYCDGAAINGECFIARGNNDHIIYKNGTVTGSHADNGTCLTMGTHTYNCDNCEVTNNDIFTCGDGTNQGHCVYLIGSNGVIDRNRIRTSNGGYGIHLYTTTNTHTGNVVSRNTIYNNTSRPGILVSSQFTQTLVYDNIIYDNDGGIELQGTTNYVFNNTIYQNNHAVFSGICVWVNGGSGHLVQNNICYLNSSDTITQSGGTATADHNLLGTNPQFVSAGSDFHLTSSSTGAINQGTALTSYFTIDFDGVPRGTLWDIGAYEFTSAVITGGGFPTKTIFKSTVVK